jgi:hypothetical protein
MELAETRQLFEQCIKDAREETKIGGDPAKGLVHATCALAIATHLNESPVVELTGSITVDGIG